jgi:hypothetical protein
MARRRLVAALAVAALYSLGMTTVGLAQNPPQNSDVPVRGVVLFSSGVGYFEHFGTVTGDAQTELRFKTVQINDILKSLVLQDLDGGKVAGVNYASQEPLQRKLQSFQVDISGQPTLASLLAQLRGAKVTLVAGDRTIAGTILGVEKRQVAAGQVVIEKSVVSVLAGGVIKSELLDDVRELRLDDAVLQDELTRALAALSGARDQEKKTVTLRFTGTGERRVRVGYVVETPVWKTSYRLLMGDKPSVQGWAIVENQTDADWKDVQLSLVSGRPISFVQDLYTPLFVPRPVVVPELFASLRPQSYAGGTGGLADRDGERAEAEAGSTKLRRAGRVAANMAPAPTAGAPGSPGGFLAEQAPMDAAASVASVASASQVGELFQYTVGSVTLPRQTSAMLPIVTDAVELEKVSIYNASVMPRNPLNGVRLKNTTDKHLLAGPVTVLEAGTYAGDAQLTNTPPGQSRLMSYGVDLQMNVDATKRNQKSDVTSGSAARGVLRLQRKTILTQEYLAENKSPVERKLVVEHPRQGGEWKLTSTPAPLESTDSVHRFQTSIAAGKSSTLTVTEELIHWEAVSLMQMDTDDYLRYAAIGTLPDNVRTALTKAADLRRAIATTERTVEQRKTRIQETSTEQNRIRENLRTVDKGTDYARRLLEKLNTQETEIEKLQTEIGGLDQTLTKQRNDLAEFLAGLNL